MLNKKTKLLFITILLIIITFIIVLYYSRNQQKNIEENIITVNDVLELINDNKIDSKFISWIEINYNDEILNILYTYLKDNNYNPKIWHDLTGYSLNVLIDKYNKVYDNMNNIKEIKTNNDVAVLNFVGDVSLADNWYIAPKYDQRKKGIYGILSEDIVSLFNSDELTVVNSEFTVSSRGTPLSNKLYTFRSSKNRLLIYREMGVDLVTLANNHVYDYGLDAFYDMIDAFNEYNIPYIGAGKNIEEAKKIYYFIINGYKIAFVNATRAEKNIMTKEADEDSGGVLRCYDTTIFKEVIKKAKDTSDYVIALVHYGKEYSHALEDVQIESSHEYIELGADVIIGTHAHVLQGIEFYNNKPIIYNLGNFIFNNENIDTGIFQIKLDKEGNMKYYFIPAYQSGEYTYLLDNEESKKLISNINKWSINVTIDLNMEIRENDE